MNNARDKHEYGHKWGETGPSYLLSENGDLSFLLFFSKQYLKKNFQRKLQKNLSVTLNTLNTGKLCSISYVMII